MEHHPYITFNDETELTYSDIHVTDGHEYINVYFETPAGNDFNHMNIVYPGGVITSAKGYTMKEIEELFQHFNIAAPIAFDFAKEECNAETV